MAQFSLTAASVLLLLSVALLCTNAAAACCSRYVENEISIARINGYSIQTNRGRCHINAVIFHTIKGKDLCADPAQPWVMNRIKFLREKVKSMKGSNTTSQAN
ncbi:C-C motif chemokine 2-like [Scleropages formosus]|uniref:C-C motif chemokine 2-like n=1 Tax=Scleropages formosus TaxID=113540 RepID=A0A8C9RMV4_SCLFO|nr:C-C motif chemokine 2-like [Scleropages formosus]